MKILLTNDDGIHAPGMDVLREIAAELSDDIWVVAPASEQSAASRGVSLHNPLMRRKLEDKVFSVSGTPTDSVILGIREVMADNPPDLVLSGVNRGQNLAEDVTFSGTVAGALQGMQMGVPSIALSLAKGFQSAKSLPWDTALKHGPKVIKRVVAAGWPKDVILNVNFPDRAPDDVAGIQVTRQGHRDFNMTGAVRRDHPRGGHYYWLTYGGRRSNPPAGTDLRAIYDGYISITPLHTDLTHLGALDDLAQSFDAS